MGDHALAFLEGATGGQALPALGKLQGAPCAGSGPAPVHLRSQPGPPVRRRHDPGAAQGRSGLLRGAPGIHAHHHPARTLGKALRDRSDVPGVREKLLPARDWYRPRRGADSRGAGSQGRGRQHRDRVHRRQRHVPGGDGLRREVFMHESIRVRSSSTIRASPTNGGTRSSTRSR